MEQTAKSAAVEAQPRIHYGFIVLALIVLAVFSSLGLARFGYTSILPAMQDALHLTNTQTGELQSWNLTGYLLAVVIAGVLAARYGPRAVISVSLLIVGIGMFVTGSIPTFDGARIGRFLAGVGGAGGNVPAMGLISSWFGSRRRGFASGVGVVGSSLGLMLTGPLIPAIITQYGTDGWRISWYVLAALVLVCFVLCVLFLRNKPDGMGLAPIGESQSDTVKRQGDARASSLDWGLVYKPRVLWQLAAIYFAFGYSYITYSTFFIKYLVKEGGFTQAGAGTLWFQIGVVTTISGFFWGAVSDRWGRRLALICVFFLQGASFLSLGLSRDLPSVYFSSLLFAITAWSIPALMAAIAGDVFGARLAPAALGLVTIVFGIGQALAPYTAGAIADSTQSFSLAFIIAGIVAFLGAFGSFAMRRSFSSS